jgi:hypothetical protein
MINRIAQDARQLSGEFFERSGPGIQREDFIRFNAGAR